MNRTNDKNAKAWFPAIQTERLLLREITSEDAQTIVELRNDPRVYRFFRSPHAITVPEHMQWYTGHYLADRNRCDWLAFLDGHPIGIFALTRLDDPSTMEVNYWLCPTSWGKGYAQEAVNALTEQAKAAFQVNTIYATIHRENSASIRFAERMGFRKKNAEDIYFLYEKNL